MNPQELLELPPCAHCLRLLKVSAGVALIRHFMDEHKLDTDKAHRVMGLIYKHIAEKRWGRKYAPIP